MSTLTSLNVPLYTNYEALLPAVKRQHMDQVLGLFDAMEWNVKACYCAHFAANLARDRRGILSSKRMRPKVGGRILGLWLRSQNVMSPLAEIFSTPENVDFP